MAAPIVGGRWAETCGASSAAGAAAEFVPAPWGIGGGMFRPPGTEAAAARGEGLIHRDSDPVHGHRSRGARGR